MKKIICIFSAFVSIMTSVSCGKESNDLNDSDDPFEAFLAKPSYSPDPDYCFARYPVLFSFVVTDAEGNNLFDESTPDNWVTETFSATFSGQNFSWPSNSEEAFPLEYDKLKGFYFNPILYPYSDDDILLRFGNLSCFGKWDKDLNITWPDGSEDVIRIQYAIRWDKTGLPETYIGFKVNGVPIEGMIIRLTK